MEKKPATEANVPAIAPEEGETKVISTTQEDLEARNVALEAEKNRLIEESANYKMAYLKEKRKKGDIVEDEDTDDDRMRRIAQETLATSRLAEIAREQDEIIKKALKENKELKLAHLNRPTSSPATVGSHTEGQPVPDTSITPDQLAAFKAKGWTEKDIERYKKNLKRYGGGR